MTEKDNNLLLKDLCARLPYGLCVEDEYGDVIHVSYTDVHFANYFDSILNRTIKPYLFPLSSMTEEQLYNNPVGFVQMLIIKADRDWENVTINRRAYYKLVDWFNKNHFDYRGLIEKGLAIDATGLNIY